MTTTTRARLVISLVSLIAVVAGLVGQVAGVDTLRIAGLGGYLLFGAGAAPWVLFRGPDLTLRLVLSVGTSLSGLIVLSTVMLQLGAWHPWVAAAIVLAATVPLHVLGLRSAVRENPAVPLRLPAAPPALLLSATGAIICFLAAATHRHLTPGIWGFLVEIGPWWYVGLGLVVAGLALARSAGEAVTAIGVLLLMLVLTGTPGLVYDGPRLQAAVKHLEFVDQIRSAHHLSSTVPVYNGWPGYFAAMAWLCDVTGIRDSTNLAMAWPALIGLGRLIAMRYLAGQLIADRYQAWLAVAFAILADTVGQDYFSPQSVGFVLGLMVFGLALSPLPAWPKFAAMSVAGVAISVTHQLSPYAVGGVLAILAVFRMIRPWWLPAAVLAPAGGWALLHWRDLGNFLNLSSIGNSDNFKPPATMVTPGLSRLAVVPITSAALLLGVLLLGLLAAVTLFRRRRERAIWAVALCPSVGMVIILVNPYGNEGIFRATLFGIPWLAVLAAQAFRPSVRLRPSVPMLATLLTLVTTFSIATFGMDASNVVSPQDREATRRFQAANTGPGDISYLLNLGPGDVPSSPPSQSRTHISLKRSDFDTTAFALSDGTVSEIEASVTDKFVDYIGTGTTADHLYAIWSPVSSYYGEEYGIQTKAQFAAYRDAFANSPSWATVYSSHGTVLFQYTGRQ
ncbi:hypothetical protein [Actinoplanes sp. NPDC026619]|uniref:hypothetical protein n=1 Tax=Actinoplanes sp. NPDC026619 TaxID=3155798 RepID=UPI003401FF00